MNAAELTDSLAEAWDALLHTPLFGIALTLAVAGQKKRDVIEAAIKEGPGSPYPIGRVLADVELPVDIHWSAE